MDKKKFHFYYGIILVIVGIGVFYRTPQVMQQIADIEFFRPRLMIVRVCCYILGTLVAWAGVLKILKNYK